MNHNRLFRNTNNKMIGGVASGLADYFEVDVTVIRVLMILAFFIPIPFHVSVLYIILWVVMPDIAKRPKALQEGQIPSQN